MASFMMRSVREIEPNDVIEIGVKCWFRCRYITNHGTQTTLHLQPENESLSPFVQNDVVHLSVNRNEEVMLRVRVNLGATNEQANS